MATEKIRINYDIVETKNEIELTEKNGNCIKVKTFIPYEEKELMAYEFASLVQVVDEENGICYESFQKLLAEAYLVVKYYTNIDVSDVEPDRYGKLFDYQVCIDLYHPIMEAVDKDFGCFVDYMAHHLMWSAKERFQKANSLSAKLEKTFGFLFSGEDLTQQISSAEDIQNKMIDMFAAVRERDEKNALLKNSKAKVKSGGSVLNMAKK